MDERSGKEGKALTAPASQSRELSGGRNMTSSDCVLREGRGRPTIAGKRGRYRNSGGKVKFDDGHPALGMPRNSCGTAHVSAPKDSQSQQEAERQRQNGNSRSSTISERPQLV